MKPPDCPPCGPENPKKRKTRRNRGVQRGQSAHEYNQRIYRESLLALEEFGLIEMDEPVNKRLPEHTIEVVIPFRNNKHDTPSEE